MTGDMSGDGSRAIVHVVDDDAAVRDSLAFLLESQGLATCTYSSASALLETGPARRGCVLTDFQMPGMDGLQLQAALTERGIGLPVIVMTGHGDVPMAVRAMKAGAVDFLEKPFADHELLGAIGRALERDGTACAAAAAAAAAGSRLGRLTPREREVLALMVEGEPNKAIARALGTSPRTIDVHRARVLQKLEVGSLPELVRLVLAAGSGEMAG